MLMSAVFFCDLVELKCAVTRTTTKSAKFPVSDDKIHASRGRKKGNSSVAVTQKQRYCVKKEGVCV